MPSPNGLAFDANRNLHIADYNGYIEKIVFSANAPVSAVEDPITVPCDALTVSVSIDNNVCSRTIAGTSG